MTHRKGHVPFQESMSPRYEGIEDGESTDMSGVLVVPFVQRSRDDIRIVLRRAYRLMLVMYMLSRDCQ